MNSPNWIRKAIIYQIFIDRFNGYNKKANTANFMGGNLKGVTNKLDYIKNLGANVIWLSPFYETNKYHGYHVTDFKKIDPYFGNTKDFKNLILEAKSRNLKILIDFIPNHCSVEHPFFKDAKKNKNSIYHKWFTFKKWPNDYLYFLHFKQLPKLNLDNPDTRKYILEVADYWMSFGIDGFRIDHVIGPSINFWEEFKIKIIDKYPQAYFFGEAWAGGMEKKYFGTLGIKNKLLRKYFGISQEKIQLDYYKLLSGAFNFSLNSIIIDAVKKNVDVLKDENFKVSIMEHLEKIPPDYLMVNFLDNHDMDRFLKHCKGEIKKLLNAFELLFSLDYPVVIYYATENCTYNKISVHSGIAHADLFARGNFDWENINMEFVKGFKKLVKKYGRGIY